MHICILSVDQISKSLLSFVVVTVDMIIWLVVLVVVAWPTTRPTPSALCKPDRY